MGTDAELRCAGKLQAKLLDDGDIIEIKCDSRVCGAGRGVVVLHQFNLVTGEVKTLRFRDPACREKVKTT